MKTKTINLKVLRTPKILLAAFLTLFLSAGFATAQSLNGNDVTEPSVPFAQAMEIALGTGNGELVSLDLGYKSSTPHYRAELKDETSYTVLRIDGVSGEILETQQISASSTEELHAMLKDRRHKGRKGHGRHKGSYNDDDYDDDDDDDDDDRSWFDRF
jgi:hypothetical protein